MEPKTPVSLLQETLSRMKCMPVYNVLRSQVNQDNPDFIYEVSGLGHSVIGTGRSMKAAKHAAAENLLKIVSASYNEFGDMVDNPFTDKISENAIGKLQECCQARGLPLPEFKLISEEGPAHCKEFCMQCSILVSENEVILAQGIARSKRQAKHFSALKMLTKLQKKDFVDDGTCTIKEDIDVESICKKLKETRLVSEGSPSSKTKQSLPTDFDNIFKTDVFMKSPVLSKIRGQPRSFIEGLPNQFNIFKTLMEELDLSWRTDSIPSTYRSKFIKSIKIDSFYGTTFWGLGEDENSALMDAVTSGLNWFAVMSN